MPLRPLRNALVATILVVAAILALAGLQAAGIAGHVGFTIFWSLGTLAMSGATTLTLLRGDAGGAVAWGYIALILAIGQVLLSLQIATMDISPVCSAIYSACPINSPLAWIPCGLAAGTTWLLWMAIRGAKAAAPQL